MLLGASHLADRHSPRSTRRCPNRQTRSFPSSTSQVNTKFSGLVRACASPAQSELVASHIPRSLCSSSLSPPSDRHAANSDCLAVPNRHKRPCSSYFVSPFQSHMVVMLLEPLITCESLFSGQAESRRFQRLDSSSGSPAHLDTPSDGKPLGKTFGPRRASATS